MKKACDRFVDSASIGFVPFAQTSVLVPPVVVDTRTEQFDKADAAIHQSAGDQALSAENVRNRIVHAVEGASRLGFPAKIDQLGHSGLHSESEFVIGDGGFEFVVSADAVDDLLIEPAQQGA